LDGKVQRAAPVRQRSLRFGADPACGHLQRNNCSHILITAQDLFFTPLPTANALELAAYVKDNLQGDYKLDVAPKPTKIAGRAFTFFAYSSPVAEMHWYVVGTEIRCHAVEFVLTSRDTGLLDSLVANTNGMQLPTEASPSGGEGSGGFPACIRDYAKDENLVARVDPILTEHRFSPIPVRIIIDKNGNVKHIHLLSAFPGQDKVITDALLQWKFGSAQESGEVLDWRRFELSALSGVRYRLLLRLVA
jgi:hypothetical protein